MVQHPEYSLIHGDCRKVLNQLDENCLDALCTDAPYGLGFMNKNWDKEVPGPDYWKTVLRVLKPGAHGLVMGGTRTFHRLICAIEDSGFEFIDTLMWLYSSGFPKSHNAAMLIDKHFGHKNRGRAIPTASTYQASDKEQKNKLESNPVGEYEPIEEAAKEWNGYGTKLKPAYEPIFLIRKPMKGTISQTVLEHRTGVLNIDGCRIGYEPVTINRFTDGAKPFGNGAGHEYQSTQVKGRFPANVCHDGSDEVLELFPYTKSGTLTGNKTFSGFLPGTNYENQKERTLMHRKGDEGSAARFFFCSKASKKEKEFGLENFMPKQVTDGRHKTADNAYQRGASMRKNTHPTVKPIKLGQWLSRLICPKGGTILDMFAGSGSFGISAILEGFNWIGIENDEEGFKIAEARMKAWNEIIRNTTK